MVSGKRSLRVKCCESNGNSTFLILSYPGEMLRLVGTFSQIFETKKREKRSHQKGATSQLQSAVFTTVDDSVPKQTEML